MGQPTTAAGSIGSAAPGSVGDPPPVSEIRAGQRRAPMTALRGARMNDLWGREQPAGRDPRCVPPLTSHLPRDSSGALQPDGCPTGARSCAEVASAPRRRRAPTRDGTTPTVTYRRGRPWPAPRGPSAPTPVAAIASRPMGHPMMRSSTGYHSGSRGTARPARSRRPSARLRAPRSAQPEIPRSLRAAAGPVASEVTCAPSRPSSCTPRQR